MTIILLVMAAVVVLLVAHGSYQIARLVYDDSPRAIRRRWARINAARPRVCPCGDPGTILRSSGPAQWWYCEHHTLVPLDTGWSNQHCADGRATCLKGCGWYQDVTRVGTILSSGGPIASNGCDHAYGEPSWWTASAPA